MTKRQLKEYQRRIRARWVKAGRCRVCGKKRGVTTRRASWGNPHGPVRFRRQSKSRCAYHLARNVVYARRHRERTT